MANLKFGVLLFPIYAFASEPFYFDQNENARNTKKDICSFLDDTEISRIDVTRDVKKYFLLNKCKPLHVARPFF